MSLKYPTIVTLYKDAGFKGQRYRFENVNAQDEGVSDFRRALYKNIFGYVQNWNDEVSSIVILNGSATFYRDINYKGSAVTLPAGEYNLDSLRAHGIPNDSISSMTVHRSPY